MIRKVIEKYFEDIKNELNARGLSLDVKFSSDVSLISEYTKSYKFRTMFGDNLILNKAEQDNINKAPNFSLLMYNRTSIQKYPEVGNNMNNQMLTTTQQAADEWLTIANASTDITYQIRDILYGQIVLTCKFLTSNSNTLEALEFLMENNFIRKNPPVAVALNVGEGLPLIELDYNTIHEGIDEFGFINSNLYGDIQQLSFSVTIHGLFLSMFKKDKREISTLEVEYQLI